MSTEALRASLPLRMTCGHEDTGNSMTLDSSQTRERFCMPCYGKVRRAMRQFQNGDMSARSFRGQLQSVGFSRLQSWVILHQFRPLWRRILRRGTTWQF